MTVTVTLPSTALAERIQIQVASNRIARRNWMPGAEYIARHCVETSEYTPASRSAREQTAQRLTVLRSPFIGSGVLTGHTAHLRLAARHARHADDGRPYSDWEWTLEDQAQAMAERRHAEDERARATR